MSDKVNLLLDNIINQGGKENFLKHIKNDTIVATYLQSVAVENLDEIVYLKAVEVALTMPHLQDKLTSLAEQALKTLGKDDLVDCLENDNSHLMAEFLSDEIESQDILGEYNFGLQSFFDDIGNFNDMAIIAYDKIADVFIAKCRQLVE